MAAIFCFKEYIQQMMLHKRLDADGLPKNIELRTMGK